MLRADGDKITIGADSNIQDLALCHVDPGKPLTIGERVTVGHGAILRGCTIEDDVLIGTGCATGLWLPLPAALLCSSRGLCVAHSRLRRVCRATIMNGARIGRGCIVGAGTIVLEHFQAPPYSLVVGSPATVKREYTDKAACLARAAKQAHQYCARAAAYRRSLREMLDQPEGAGCRQWEPAAWEEAAARLGYPRLLGDDGGGGAARGGAASVVAAEPAPDAAATVGTTVVPREGGDDGGESGDSAAAPRLGGVGSIVVAAAAGAVASIALTALRRVRT